MLFESSCLVKNYLVFFYLFIKVSTNWIRLSASKQNKKKYSRDLTCFAGFLRPRMSFPFFFVSIRIQIQDGAHPTVFLDQDQGTVTVPWRTSKLS